MGGIPVEVAVKVVRINDPILWWERCQWIMENCQEWHDRTQWAAFQIGLEDILIEVSEQDAVLYYLTWDT
jgi:hypothetical protein